MNRKAWVWNPLVLLSLAFLVAVAGGGPKILVMGVLAIGWGAYRIARPVVAAAWGVAHAREYREESIALIAENDRRSAVASDEAARLRETQRRISWERSLCAADKRVAARQAAALAPLVGTPGWDRMSAWGEMVNGHLERCPDCSSVSAVAA